ncbi:Uncharacterised protein [Vibrio cholerae]|nr:Uncharacterised protein [Vibrio cholerae]
MGRDKFVLPREQKIRYSWRQQVKRSRRCEILSFGITNGRRTRLVFTLKT